MPTPTGWRPRCTCSTNGPASSSATRKAARCGAETTISDTRDVAIGKRLQNLPALREIGSSANRRLLDVERTSHACTMDEERFVCMNQPLHVGTQRTAALRFADPTVPGLFSVLVLFFLLARGFTNREFRERLAPLLGLPLSAMTLGRTSYQLRRLRLHGLIERQPRTNRHRVTKDGLRTALFCAHLPPAAPPGLSGRQPRLSAGGHRPASPLPETGGPP